MKLIINANRAFSGDGFLAAVSLSDAKRKNLMSVRDRVRTALRDGFIDLSRFAKRDELFERGFEVLGTSLSAPRPKFRLQGSFAYETINAPAHMPPQEIDIDDGLFLPTSFVSGKGAIRPHLASRGFFLAVERILEPLCRSEGWKLDLTKPTCVRIDVARDAHVDIPLYAIPDDEFSALAKAAMALDTRRKDNLFEGVEFAEAVYRQLDQDQVMLAHREEGWKPSNPRRIEDWFDDAIAAHGEALRRVCRYVKAWRDFQWQDSGFSSIAVMVCVVKAFDELNGDLPSDRDDVAMLLVAKRLPDFVRDRSLGIVNPALPDQRLDEKWTAAERQEIADRAADLHGELSSALSMTFSREHALSRLRNSFGPRFPNDVTKLDVKSEEAEIKSYAPSTIAIPMVNRTTSG